MLWLLIWRRALPTPSATSPALHGSSLQPLLVSVWSSTQQSSCSDPSYLIRPARSTPKNKAGGGAARKGSASAVFVGFTRKKRRHAPMERTAVWFFIIQSTRVSCLFFSKRYLQKMVLLYWAKARCAVLSPVRRSHGSLPPQRL